jgi:hypothetical protein
MPTESKPDQRYFQTTRESNPLQVTQSSCELKTNRTLTAESGGPTGPYLNTQSFENTLKTAVQIQGSLLNAIFGDQSPSSQTDEHSFPKVRKSCRSFKEVAEVVLS